MNLQQRQQRLKEMQAVWENISSVSAGSVTVRVNNSGQLTVDVPHRTLSLTPHQARSLLKALQELLYGKEAPNGKA